MIERNKIVGDIEVKITMIEQTEEISSEPIKLSSTQEEKIICDYFGKKRIFKNGKWEEVSFKDFNIDNDNKVEFRIQVKSDFPPID